MSKRSTLALAALTSGLMLGAPAAASAQSGLYLGAGVGTADFEDNIEIEDVEGIDLNDDDTTYRYFIGYRANPNLAIEGGYRDFGEASSGPFTVETDGWEGYVLGIAPIGPIELFAKGGFIAWETDGNRGLGSQDDVDLAYGVGGAVNLGPIFLRLEGEWFDIDFPEDVQAFTGSVGYRF